MAGGVIVSIGEGMYDSLWGNVQGPMKVFLETTYEGARKAQLTIWEKIFKPFQLDSHNATIATSGSLGLFEDVGQNGNYPNTQLGDGFNMLLAAETWKLAVYISQEMMEDKLTFAMKNEGKQLLDSYIRTRNNFFMGMLKAALQGKDYVSVLKNRYSTKTMDGVNLFATNHKLANSKKTVSNAFSDAFSKNALDKVSTEMQNMVDDNGEIIGLVPDTIIIPNTAKAKDEVFGILGAHNDPNTPAGNRYNYQFGNWDVLVIPWLNDLVAADGSYPWILMDSNYNESNYGAIDVERIPLAITSDKDRNNDANRWAGRARFGGAFGNFRAFAAGGLDFGTAA